MRFIPHFNFDQISFWLGFVAASLFWWLFSRFKFIFPATKSFIREQKTAFEKRRTYGTELYLRRETLKKAQKLHLANELCSLDEVLIQPYLIAPPGSLTPDNPVRTDTLIHQTIPYFPDLPELSSQFNITRLTPVEALQGGANILIIGQPGSGKTVALADLASKLSRKDEQAGILKEKLPVFLHIMDLALAQSAIEPELILIQAVSEQATALISKRLSALLVRNLKQGNCLLILDGLDELPPANLQVAAKFLQTLFHKFPGNQFIAAISHDYLDGLPDLKTFPLALALWKQEEKITFYQKWETFWRENYTSQHKNTDSNVPPNPTILANWFYHDHSQRTPLEWTLRIWAVLAADVKGSTFFDMVRSYLERISKNTVPAEALSAGAMEIIQSRQCSITYKTLSKIFSKLRPQDFPEKEEPALQAEIDLLVPKNTIGKRFSKRKRTKRISSADRAITTLLDAGILIEHRNDQLRFASPLLTGFFAALTMEEINFDAVEKEKWAVELCTLQFMAARDKATLWVQEALVQSAPPFFQSLLSVCRAIQYTSTSHWRSDVMRYLLDKLYNQNLSLMERTRILALIALTNDSSLSILFRKLLRDGAPEIRFLAALGCGLIQDSESITQLQQTLRDPTIEVQLAACLGLSAMMSPHTTQIIVDALLQGEEDVQQIAAETLAFRGGDGHEALKEALNLDNLMIRRAAVLGLSQIREKWAIELLQKVSIEDGQWVVRNAAGQAHDTQQAPNQQIPKPLTQPSETPWLITFASEKGQGIIPDEDATEILLSALKTGSTAERIAALDYLRLTPDREVIDTITSVCETAQNDLHAACLLALWQLNISETSA